MNYVLDCVNRLLGSTVVPVAAALDEQPSSVEEGRRDAAARAAAIRAGLAELLCARDNPQDDLAAVYEAARSLLSDLLGEVMADARTAVPAAREWATQAAARAVTRAVAKGAAAG